MEELAHAIVEAHKNQTLRLKVQEGRRCRSSLKESVGKILSPRASVSTCQYIDR